MPMKVALVVMSCALLVACEVQRYGGPRAAMGVAPGSGGGTAIAGTWNISESRTQNGGSYSGTVTISPEGSAYSVQWNTNAGSYSGIGLVADTHFFVGWGAVGGNSSIVLYRVGGDGSLSGQWTSPGVGALGWENATGGAPGAIEGNYAVNGANPGGGNQYQGSLQIARNGDVYGSFWNVGAQYQGIGLADGGWLGVGWGNSGVGVIEYTIVGNTMQGRWATTGDPRIGIENLAR